MRETRKYYDEGFAHKSMILESLERENRSQFKKWGIQEHTLAEWMLFLTEEIGELAQAIGELEFREGTYKEVYDEAVQSAMLSIKIAEMVMKVSKK